MGDVRDLHAKRPHYFTREVTRIEYYKIDAVTSKEARELLERSLSPMKSCIGTGIIRLGEFIEKAAK